MAKDPNVSPDDPRLKWLETVTGCAVQSSKNLDEVAERKESQDMVNMRLPDTARDEIKASLMALTVKVGSKSMKVLDGGGDTDSEIDTVHHVPKLTEALSEEDLKVLNAQMAKIYAIQDELKKNPAYAVPEPDFISVESDDPAELRLLMKARADQEAAYAHAKSEADMRLAEDLWLPLQREGVIPENLVPENFSAVANQFKAASELYEDRLQEYSRDLTEKDILGEKFELAMKLGKATLKLMTAGADVAGSIAELAGDDSLGMGVEEATAVMEHLSTALAVTESAGKTALTDGDFSSVASVAAGAVAEVLTSSIGPELGGMVGTAIASAARGVKTAKLVKGGDFQGAAKALMDGIAAGCAGFDKTDGKLITEIGALIKAQMTSFIAGWSPDEAISSGKSPQEVMQSLLTELAKVSTAAAKSQGGKLAAEFAGDALKDDGEPGVGDHLADRQEAAAIINLKFDMAALMKSREEAAAKMADEMADQTDANAEEFRLALVTGFAMPTNDEDEVQIEESHRLASIDYILAVQQKNAATFALCKTIAEKGTALVVKMFPGASLVEACLTLTFTIQDTIAKAQELIIWQENFRDAQAASSAQVDAFLSRKGLQTKQTAQAGIQLALDAAKVVAEVLLLTPAAPAAPVVKAAAEATEAAFELADIIYTEAQMAAGWRIYQQARDNPGDRYLARQATQKNPTLAKYAMAWAATKGDPIAVEGMRRCGLNEHTLALPDTNVAKVVSYLEAKYADDPILLRAVPVKQKWHPGPVVLSLRSWAGFYQMATTKAVPAVSKTNDISGINAGLGDLEDAEAAFADAVKTLLAENKTRSAEDVATSPGAPSETVTNQLLAALYKLTDNFRRFKSLDVDGAKHAEMASYIDAMAAKVDQRLSAVEGILHDKPWA
jgi:hypothetical protein